MIKNILKTGFFILATGSLIGQISLPAKFRNIGPFRGGRSVSVSGVKGDQLTYYMGTTGGGLWKSTDAGHQWNNISDGYFTTGSVGAIAVSESHPYIVYVGMGEHAPRGVMTSHGDGVYKSTDAGKTWTKIGLEKTQHISRIQIHPTNPDIVYVAAQGALYGPNPERGIFKTEDGGLSWKKVLYVNDLTGASELSMDKNFPHILYAAMWEHQRLPWQVISGGKGSGLYKSTDGGNTWIELTQGLPVEKGKMAISVSGANSNKVYALIESDTQKDLGGLFVSNDAGENWNMVSGDNRLTQRAWYYTEVFADPQNENLVYVLSAPALKSIDGGKNWEVMTNAHGDYHDMWINPDKPENIVIADDGGAAISFNRGETWSRQDNMPTAQLYRINTDRLFPYKIYAGQQDNTSLSIQSIALGRSGISRENWSYSAGGESAFLAFDPDNPQKVMGGSYLGTIEILDMVSNSSTNIMIEPIQYLGREARDMKYLFNWNAPIVWSVHEPNTFYHCAQYVLKTKDFGNSWEVISPDLTRNDDSKQGNGGAPFTNEAVGAENYGTIAYLMESPHEKGVLWTGSDDGLIHLTRDGGLTWSNVTPKGLEECLINAIEVSPHDPATAYIATTRYKFNDHKPGLYVTTDYGKTWTSINQGIPTNAFTRVIREDTQIKGLLFAGTETGLFLSRDSGKNWQSFQLNLPITPITDLKITFDDLVVATSGRSFWILDDLQLIREFKDSVTAPLIYTPEKAILGNWGSPFSGNISNFDGTDPFEGVNPANGAVIYYHLPENHQSESPISLEIYDDQKRLVRTFSSETDREFISYDGGPPSEPTLPNSKGIQRFFWDLRYSTLPGIPTAYIESSYRGHRVMPGTYTAKLTIENGIAETQMVVESMPHVKIENETYQGYHEFMQEMEAKVAEMHSMVNQLYQVQGQLESFLKENLPENLRTKGKELFHSLKIWDEEMVQRKSLAYDDVENFPNKFTANYMFLMNQTESQIPRVNEGSKIRKKELDVMWEGLKKQGQRFLLEEIPGFNQEAFNAGFGFLNP